MIESFSYRGEKIQVSVPQKGRLRVSAQDFTASLRELEVIRLKAEGFGHQQVAIKLGISTHTVRNHLTHLVNANDSHMRKGTEHIVISLIRRADKLGLLDPLTLKGLEAYQNGF